MATGQQAAVLEGVRRIFSGGTVAGLGSESLLRRFATRGDEAAFSAIVARHGPMVLGVCRRALRDSHDVEDAFQATFLVFVRKAGSIRDGETLGPWLYGVAHRVATRARVNASRRRANERTGVDLDPAGTSSEPDAESSEIRAVIDAEIGRLPERYRNPIILCDLEGCSQPEAAGRLGWTEGSLRGRLARARELLRKRLLHRGLVAPAGAIGGLIATDTASAGRLGEALARALVGASAGRVEGVSTTAVTLAREVLEAMMRFKVLSIGLAAFVAGAALSGASAFGIIKMRQARNEVNQKPPEASAQARFIPPRPTLEDDVDPPQLPSGNPPGLPDVIPASELKNPPPPEPADTRRIALGDRIDVQVLEALPGRQIAGERLVRPDGTVGLGFYGDLKLVGLTRREAKVKVIEHLRQVLTDEALGLFTWNEKEQKYDWRHPAYSDRVFVDDSPTYDSNYRSRPVRASAIANIGTPQEPSPQRPSTAAGAHENVGVPTTKPGGHVISNADIFAIPAVLANPPQQSQIPEAPRKAQAPGGDHPEVVIAPQEDAPPFPSDKTREKSEPARPQGKAPWVADLIPSKDLKNPPPPEPANTHRFVVGDTIVIEVLEALPGRQITGERVVRPDGTISLHWYGDLEVVGLTRREVKVKLIEHLHQYLTDESLGLMAWDDRDKAYVWLHPARSDRVYVDDSPTFDKKPRPRLADGLHPLASPVRPAVAAPADRPPATPIKINQGDHLLVEVLQALPGRQIQGQRIVRSDGTLSLGYYGDLKVAGLTRAEAKVKLIEHLRQYLTEEILGLVEVDKSGKKTPVAPERSTRVFIEEGLVHDAPETRLDALEQKLDRVLDELQSLKKDRPH